VPRSAEVRNQDFVQTLRAEGLSEWAVTRHVLKNSLPPVMAVMGLQFGYLIGRFDPRRDGVHLAGQRLSVEQGDHQSRCPRIAGTILTLSLVFVATNLVIDLLQSLIDPRIRRG